MQQKIEAMKSDSNEEEKLGISKEKEMKEYKKEISNAYVAIAELFMTDLCEDSDAQTECEKYLQLSLQHNIDNIEAYATFSQFRHCQQNDKDAIKYFKLALQKLFGHDNDTEKKENDDMDGMEDKLDIFSENAWTIDSFLKIVKLGIELEQYKPCIRVLKGLMNANDEIGESWALGAFCHYKLNNKQDAAVWIHNARSVEYIIYFVSAFECFLCVINQHVA